MSRSQLFRRRIAPIAFGLAIVLLARDACNKEQRTHTTIVFDVGKHHVEDLAAELFVDGTYVANFHNAGFTGTVKFDASLPSDYGELRIDLDVGNTIKHEVRHFQATDGGTVIVPLSELATP